MTNENLKPVATARRHRRTTFVQVRKTDHLRGIVYGQVYSPLRLDSHGEFMFAEDIEEIAHKAMRLDLSKLIDTNHDNVPNGAYPVESFIARAGDPDYDEGAWVLGVQLTPELLEKVDRGELNGFSFQAIVTPMQMDVEVNILRDHVGTTEATQSHRHAFLVLFDEEGKIVKGWTNEMNGHRHVILRGSVTQPEAGHANRYFV
ncbi:XkdF-like putative serine protease domain-containing protein [Roseococcus pinisoli]|uniref:Phage-like element PBSX protein XkdF domain-containing protein n=1 Tax=Roseococcus pinisoli TaxID=2835040 RepID=A0ABS5QGQ6_9PROT|nr:XkdF-like putative serine protease domain-containing protein [Roseococcus pinisoli]MBS7812865.1 hypothetical protein [Roseococcus pinisoli]